MSRSMLSYVFFVRHFDILLADAVWCFSSWGPVARIPVAVLAAGCVRIGAVGLSWDARGFRAADFDGMRALLS